MYITGSMLYSHRNEFWMLCLVLSHFWYYLPFKSYAYAVCQTVEKTGAPPVALVLYEVTKWWGSWTGHLVLDICSLAVGGLQECPNRENFLGEFTWGDRASQLLIDCKISPVYYNIIVIYSGLFLRTLEHIQLTVYATVSYGGLLYSGGSEKIIVYYDFTVSTRDCHGLLPFHCSEVLCVLPK